MRLRLLPAGLAAAAAVPAILLDTDISIDVDDVGALCAMDALVDAGEATLLGVVHDTALPTGVGAISAINRYYGRNVPVGAYRGPVGDPDTTYGEGWTNHGRGRYADDLAAQFPLWIERAEGAPDALQVYLQVLEAADDASVTIASVGFLTNLLDLLRSDSGVALVEQKVREMVVMGGKHSCGGWCEEWNLAACGGDCGSYDLLGPISQEALSLWPPSVPIVFVPYERGNEVHTGGVGAETDNNPCYTAYVLFCSRMHNWCQGYRRASWDVMAVVVAVRGAEERFYRVETGRMSINSHGRNKWEALPDASQSMALVTDISGVEEEIQELLRRPAG